MTDDRERNFEEPGTGKPEDVEEPTAAGAEEEEPESVHHGIEDRKGRRTTPWAWVPSLYFAEGIPYIVAMTLSVIMYKNLGISNKDIGFWTSILYLPWVVKPLWGPLVDKYWTKRNWVIWMQLFLAICFAGVAFGVQLPSFFLITLLFLWGIAFLSATHDIAADGTYMLGLSEHQQAWYVGYRSTFYRLAMIAGTGLLPIFAGLVQTWTGLPPLQVTAVGVPAMETKAPPASDSTHGASASASSKMIILSDKNVLEVPAGETRSFKITLSAPPEKGKEVVVNLSRRKGDKSLSIEEGERLVFNADNWNIPQNLTIKADPKLKTRVSAEFRGVAGNIHLSWLVVFAMCAVLFALFFFYHGLMLPFPKSDSPEVGYRPPFIKPVFWLLLAVAIPSAIGVGVYIGLDKVLADSFRKLLVALSSESSPVVTKGYSFFFAIARLVIIGVIVWVIFQFNVVRRPVGSTFNFMSDKSQIGFVDVFVTFFKKNKIGIMLAFLLLYRLGEAQLVKMAQPFMLDTREKGGLALTVGQVGLVYGTVGILALTVGGILGGLLVASGGLKKWLWPMALAINAPDLVYVYLSKVLPTSFTTINICVAIEQFGYGFGFTAYMLYMIYISQGKYKTAHFALTTGFMALGMMIPGMASGFLENILGYHQFFIAVVLFTIPGFLILPFLPIDETFGVKEKKKV